MYCVESVYGSMTFVSFLFADKYIDAKIAVRLSSGIAQVFSTA